MQHIVHAQGVHRSFLVRLSTGLSLFYHKMLNLESLKPYKKRYNCVYKKASAIRQIPSLQDIKGYSQDLIKTFYIRLDVVYEWSIR
ncbi:hypothetical protein D3C73_1416160 [compost metagenome]